MDFSQFHPGVGLCQHFHASRNVAIFRKFLGFLHAAEDSTKKILQEAAKCLYTLSAMAYTLFHEVAVGAPFGTDRRRMTMRFTDNQDGTITDTETGLMWQQGTMEKKDWDHAILACSELNLAGHEDWRLPTIKDLFSIVDFERDNPACDPVFNAKPYGYWSSSTYQGNPTIAWYAYFDLGGTDASSKTNGYYVRAVRAGGGITPCA